VSWLLVYSALAAGPLLLVTIVVIVNALWAPVLARYWPPPGAARPRVSALVPARNEADGIAGCVRALLAQDYPALEILVWDDGSTDATGAIVAGLAAGDRRLRLLTGPPPPPGWFGKHHACWQAAGRATGDWLLFVDADTRLAPAAVSRLVAAGGATGADLVTALPRQRVVTPGERLVVPLVYASIICLLPLPLVPRRRGRT
jgi:chlorobactene glucosyltransferase